METHWSVKIVLAVSYVLFIKNIFLVILSLSVSNKSIKWKICGNDFMWVDSSYICAKFDSF